MKKRTTIIWSSLVTILPILIYLFFWDKLPEQMPSHFNGSWEADSYSSKAFAAFGTPGILLALNLLVILFISNDPKVKNISRNIQTVVFWLIPVLSIFINSLILMVALGVKPKLLLTTNLLFAALFVVLGFVMLGLKQNYTVGIKIPWTLHSKKNWELTHRLGGKVWIVGGLLFIPASFINSGVPLFILMSALILIPCCYSFYLYKQGV